jgi:CubicO group peptidase (beta-lactamase class C family)
MILERATGISVTNYLQEKIWKPIGMAYPGSWSLDETGFEKMESGINGRAIDFAKFGRLFLHNGNWYGKQVIPATWVVESTSADTSVDYASYYGDDFIFSDGQGFYKYMWWGLQRDLDNYDIIALGNKGQLIYIVPYKDLIILRFGEAYGEFGDAQGWLEMFYKFADNLE